MTMIKISDFQARTGVGFGTSGIRARVTDLTDSVIYTYTTAFLLYARQQGDFARQNQVALAGDLRPSTLHLSQVVAQAIHDHGLTVVNCGLIPTPALIAYAMSQNMPSIMVTGSHIPADRNGIKFNLAHGEILKADEQAINSLTIESITDIPQPLSTLPSINLTAQEHYFHRYLDFFPATLLSGLRIGVYGHTAVGRDLYVEILGKLGAQVVKLGYSDIFVPIDTEAIPDTMVSQLKSWQEQHQLDSIISTDGDGDRPLLTDEQGANLPPDLIPVITAQCLGADAVACTINCNTSATLSGLFRQIELTKIGSPYVIASMSQLATQGYQTIVGYEGNGGFFTAQDIIRQGHRLPALPTRDALLPILCVLASSLQSGRSIRQLFTALPPRFTFFSSLKGVPTNLSLAVIDHWEKYRPDLEAAFGPIVSINQLDGLRLTFASGDIVHLRPSRNSPEFRDYVESDSFAHAQDLSRRAQELIKQWTSTTS